MTTKNPVKLATGSAETILNSVLVAVMVGAVTFAALAPHLASTGV